MPESKNQSSQIQTIIETDKSISRSTKINLGLVIVLLATSFYSGVRVSQLEKLIDEKVSPVSKQLTVLDVKVDNIFAVQREQTAAADKRDGRLFEVMKGLGVAEARLEMLHSLVKEQQARIATLEKDKGK